MLFLLIGSMVRNRNKHQIYGSERSPFTHVERTKRSDATRTERDKYRTASPLSRCCCANMSLGLFFAVFVIRFLVSFRWLLVPSPFTACTGVLSKLDSGRCARCVGFDVDEPGVTWATNERYSRTAFEHWKAVVHMLCECSGEMHAHLELYKAFLVGYTGLSSTHTGRSSTHSCAYPLDDTSARVP